MDGDFKSLLWQLFKFIKVAISLFKGRDSSFCKAFSKEEIPVFVHPDKTGITKFNEEV